MSFHFTCPYCQRDTTITHANFCEDIHYIDKSSKDGILAFRTLTTTCPNPKCKEYSMVAFLHRAQRDSVGRYSIQDEEKYLEKWYLRPLSLAKIFPSYIPKQIIQDYNEACAIINLSPKASATLSRRCLQGMIRDFWGISKGRLIDEITELESKTDPISWKAIDAVRKIGNIGAHMEKDINLIIDVEPNEAKLLVQLIEILLKDWYISRHEREENLKSIAEVADQKESQKKKNL
ncbi:DUF4145 domain-containing protein [Leptospira licerasiae]|uniref:DUF4145 domain-containing protein n=1 Tax=Leptospira licerasiae TaxID=447106 RepID=UPI0010841959|nr:DUF4145 domain-containing protein [Leptospira licerasiae]TGM89561.1 DUF4145 domain-containing protein [Leptospira licerasiae]